MAVTLTTLTSEVQTRCNALTGSSTAKEVIQAGIAAKKIEQAGGTITRTTLDTQLTRIANASNSGSTFADLIALAASVEDTSEPILDMYLPPIGALQAFASPTSSQAMPNEIEDESALKWLKTGVLALSSTYPLLAAKPYLKYHEVVAQNSSTNPAHRRGWAISGSTHVCVSLGNVLSNSTYNLNYSLDDGITWVTKNTGLDGDFVPMYIEHTGTHFLLIGAKEVGANTFIAYVSVATANVASSNWNASVTSQMLGVSDTFGNWIVIARAMGVSKKSTNYFICCAVDTSTTAYNMWYGPVASLVNKGSSTLISHNYTYMIGIDYLTTLDRFFVYSRAASSGLGNLYDPTANTTTVNHNQTSALSYSYYEYQDTWYEEALGRIVIKSVPWGVNNSITVATTFTGTIVPVAGLPTVVSGLGSYIGTDGTRAYFYSQAGYIIYTADWTTWSYRRVTKAGAQIMPGTPSQGSINTINANYGWKLANGYLYYFTSAGAILHKINITDLLADNSNYCGTSTLISSTSSVSYMRAA